MVLTGDGSRNRMLYASSALMTTSIQRNVPRYRGRKLATPSQTPSFESFITFYWGSKPGRPAFLLNSSSQYLLSAGVWFHGSSLQRDNFELAGRTTSYKAHHRLQWHTTYSSNMIHRAWCWSSASVGTWLLGLCLDIVLATNRKSSLVRRR